MGNRKLKVLISAYACEPEKGSEPGVGWNWVRMISEIVEEVWIITRANNRPVIEKALAQEPMPNVHWVYFDLPRWARFWKKGQRGVHLYYYLWQIGIYFLAKRLHRQIGFDLVHHVTFVNYWMPSFLSLLPVPFVWGPVGGGESAPKVFYRTFSWRGRIYEHLRSLARWLGEHDPFVRMTARKAAFALATTTETAARLRWLGAQKVEVFSQVTLSEEEISSLATIPPHKGNPFRLLSLGRLLHWKGFHLGLQAFARFVREFPRSEYWLIGDGPERKNLEALVQKLGIKDKVRFWGKLPRNEVLQKLAEVDVLVHPSLHDSGGFVCAEAMAAGRPVICLDLGGPALQVTEETGFKVPVDTPEQTVEDMAKVMLKLAKNIFLKQELANAIRRRIREYFAKETKQKQLLKIYKKIFR